MPIRERLADLLQALGERRPSAIPSVGRELMYSSGTISRPKGIRRPLTPVGQVRAQPELERRIRAQFRIDADTVYLAVSPLYHATGRFLNRVIEAGGSVVIAPGFEPEPALGLCSWRR